MSSIIKMNQHELIEQLYHVREQIRELEHQEKYLRNRIHLLMNQLGTNVMSGPMYTAQRFIRSRETIKRSEVDPVVWEELSKQIQFPMLIIEPNQ